MNLKQSRKRKQSRIAQRKLIIKHGYVRVKSFLTLKDGRLKDVYIHSSEFLQNKNIKEAKSHYFDLFKRELVYHKSDYCERLGRFELDYINSTNTLVIESKFYL